jgi:hypothetical protein
VRVYEKAIIIDEPWVSKILDREKVWEMRSKRTNFKGAIALIRKRSGTIVGTATLVGCLPPLSPEELALHEPNHCIPRGEQEAAFEMGRVVPWVLRDATRLAESVPYLHRSGQQIWVRLDAHVDRAIQAALRR